MSSFSLSVLPATRPPRRRKDRGGLVLIAVPALVALTMVLYPFLYNLWNSFHLDSPGSADGAFAGIDNYISIVKYGNFVPILLTSLAWTFGCLLFQFILGFCLGLALDREGRGIGLVRTLLLSPWVMPGVVVGSIWLSIFNPLSGVLNSALHFVGLPTHDWLGDPHTALGALIVANVWKGSPFWMLMISAGLKAVPLELHEAAKIDGASYVQRVRYVVLPGIREVLVLTALLAFIWTFNYFDLAYTMTMGGPGISTTTFPFEIYQTSFVFYRFDEGSTWSVVSFLLMLVLILGYIRVSRRSLR